jgi:hypothetical protein
VSAVLHIRAAADPQTLPRILGLFSQRWLVPSAFEARLDGEVLDIHCQVPELLGPAAAIVAAKLQEFVLVHTVEVVDQTPGQGCRSAAPLREPVGWPLARATTPLTITSPMPSGAAVGSS